MKLKGSVAVVFGGASGLGEATARRLAAGGATLLVGDLDPDGAARVAADIGGTAVEVDVVDPDSMALAITASLELGRLRILVNCAGIGTPGKLIGRAGPTPLGDFRKVVEVNLLGTINVLRCAASAMTENELEGGERGICVNTASIAAFEGQIGQVAYAASKAGVVGLTLPVARELADKAIRVVTVAPGLFDTPMMADLPVATRESLGGTVPHPSRLGAPSEYADLVAHIVSNPMLNGEVIRLDGALRMQPR